MIKRRNRGQIDITFNWIYILIAGAVILLFFLGITVRQKGVSEQRLSLDVLEIVDSILTGAEVSEQTKNFVDISSLSDYTFYFDCTERVSTYGLKGTTARETNPITPLFSPTEIKSPLLILWSLPYRLPFKIIDFLIVTSSTTQYVLVGDGAGFKNDFLTAIGTDITDEKLRFNIIPVDSDNLATVDPGDNFHLRIVDFDGTVINDGQPVPSGLDSKNVQVTGVSFRGGNAFFFRTNEGRWLSSGSSSLYSLGGERDAAKYAAIFAADAQQYDCSMQKVFQRVKLLAALYSRKLTLLQDYYDNLNQLGYDVDQCRGFVNSRAAGGYDDNLAEAVRSYTTAAESCAAVNINCDQLAATAVEVQQLNTALSKECEVTLY